MAEQIGPGRADARILVQHLQQENQRLQQVAAQQQAVIHQRAEPMALAVMDTVLRWCEWATTTGHPNQQQSQALLARWNEAMEQARRASSAIVVAQSVPPSNGRGTA